MSLTSHHGRCPACHAEGVVGHLCERPACRDVELHVVPDRWAERGERGRDPRVGRIVGRHLLVERLKRPDADLVYHVVQIPSLLEAELTLVPAERDPEVHKQLYREALALARVWHPNIERLILFGADPLGTFLVTDMQTSARTLADLIADQGGAALPPAALRLVLDPLSSALQSLAAGVLIHGEIRPEHVFLRELPGLPLFVQLGGFVRVPREGGDRGRAPRELVWSPPEQVEYAATNHTTDAYAVTAMAFPLCFGRLAFPDDDRAAVLASKRDPSYDPTAGIDAPAAALTFFRRALAHDPTDRYGDVGEYAVAFAAAIASLEHADAERAFLEDGETPTEPSIAALGPPTEPSRTRPRFDPSE